MKAYLIQQGISEKDLRDKFGHDTKKLVNEAVSRGLPLPIAALSEQPTTASLDLVPTHLRIRFPPSSPVYALGQFEPYMLHLFTAVGNALGMPS